MMPLRNFNKKVLILSNKMLNFVIDNVRKNIYRQTKI